MTNQPSWEDVPDQANYMAMDKNGIWFWSIEKPFIKKETHNSWSVKNDEKEREEWGDITRPNGDHPDWKESLVIRDEEPVTFDDVMKLIT